MLRSPTQRALSIEEGSKVTTLLLSRWSGEPPLCLLPVAVVDRVRPVLFGERLVWRFVDWNLVLVRIAWLAVA